MSRGGGADLSQARADGPRAWSFASWRRQPLKGAAIAVAVAVILAVVAWQLGRSVGSTKLRTPARATSAASGWVLFRDPAGAFEGSYPAGWHRLTPGNAGVVLIATGPDGASMLVRKAALSSPVLAANLGAARKLTEQLVRGGPDVVLLRQPQQITLGGLPGYLYLYTFANASTGQRGAHAQYFLFDGKTMITFVFQALPAASIYSLAPLFDRIAGRLRVGSPA